MKRLIALMMTLVMGMACLTGCGDTSTSTSSNGSASGAAVGEDDSLQYVLDKGTFVLGLDDNFPPMGFRDDDNNIVGFDIDLAREVCKRLGVELVCQPISWEAKEQELSSKNIDCIWNAFGLTPEREEALTCSKPYATESSEIVVLKDSSIQTLDDLKGKKGIVQTGSSVLENADAKGIVDTFGDLNYVEDNVKAMLDLDVSGSDFVIIDSLIAGYYMKQNDGKYRYLSESLSTDKLGVAFRKGDQKLCDGVYEKLQEMKKDGKLAEISNKWFGEDITCVE